MLRNEASSSPCIAALLIEEDPSLSLRMAMRGGLRLSIRPDSFKQKKAICITQMAFSVSKDYFLKYLKSLPMNLALAPNSSSIRNNWLYLAILSEREAEPVLI